MVSVIAYPMASSNDAPVVESLELELPTSSAPESSWSSLAFSMASGVSEAPLRVARHLVSGSKRRTQKESWDLDLTYILPRVIALGLPSSSFESWYRNPLSEVRSFLDSHHGSVEISGKSA